MRPKADINITPLIDVLLVLLVIFMVITPLTPQGFEAAIPQEPSTNEPKKSPDQSLIVRLDRNGSIYLNQETLEFAAILPRMKEIFSGRADRTVFVQADEEILFNEVARLMDTLRAAGATRVGLLTKIPR